MSELIESAQVLVSRIYENMTNVEACEAIAEEVVEASIAFVKNGDKIILLNDVLTDYQVERIKEDVVNQININKLESEIFLQNLSQFGPNKPDANVISTEAKGKDTIINRGFEDAINDMEDAVNDMFASREATVKKKESGNLELNYDEIRRMYIDEDMTLQQIADIQGCGRTSIYNFCKSNNINKPKKGDLAYKDGIKSTPSKRG